MTKGVLQYGEINREILDKANKSFQGATLNPLSRCCTPIELLSLDGGNSILSHASGFFWVKDGLTYLVTNFHVFSGRNFFTGEILGSMGFVPKLFRIYGNINFYNEKGMSILRISKIFELSDSATEYFSSLDNMLKNGADIVAVPIPNNIVPTNEVVDKSDIGLGEINISCALNEHLYKRIPSKSGDDVYLPGYPLRNYNGSVLPIWRRGSLATESLIGMGSYPAFLVDASVTPAMSGSPVLRSAEFLSVSDSGGSVVRSETYFDLVGVYAGRLQSADLEKTNLGYAWFSGEIDRVIDEMPLEVMRGVSELK